VHVRKAVILAAGYGTRFLPATKAIPKEMLPLVDRPAIQHVVEEAVAAGLEQIIMVTLSGRSRTISTTTSSWSDGWSKRAAASRRRRCGG